MSRRAWRIVGLACSLAIVVAVVGFIVFRSRGRHAHVKRKRPAPSASTAEMPAPISTATAADNPELIIDAEGPKLGGVRVDMTGADARTRLASAVRSLPFKSPLMTMQVDPNAKTSYVAAVVTELGKVGSERVTLKTETRKELRKEIVVMPVSQIPGAMGCAVIAMALADLSIAVWPIEGGSERRQRKGAAGPDLTTTREVLKPRVAECGSAMGFFYGDESVAWELTYIVASTMLDADEKHLLDALVLVDEPPTPGNAVRVGDPMAPYRFVPFNR